MCVAERMARCLHWQRSVICSIQERRLHHEKQNQAFWGEENGDLPSGHPSGGHRLHSRSQRDLLPFDPGHSQRAQIRPLSGDRPSAGHLQSADPLIDRVAPQCAVCPRSDVHRHPAAAAGRLPGRSWDMSFCFPRYLCWPCWRSHLQAGMRRTKCSRSARRPWRL